MTSTTQTMAERLAEQFAQALRDAGYTVTISVRHEDPVMYPSAPDEVMMDGRTHVWVSARKTIYDNSFHFGWVTKDGAGGHRATTKFYGGQVHRFCTRKDKRISTYRDLRMAVSVYA